MVVFLFEEDQCHFKIIDCTETDYIYLYGCIFKRVRLCVEWTGSARLVYREANASVHKYQRTLSYLLHIECPCPHLMGEVVHIKCDNMMAIACIKNMGSANHLWDKLTGRVFELSFTYQFSLQISYVKVLKMSQILCHENLHQYMLSVHYLRMISRKPWH